MHVRKPGGGKPRKADSWRPLSRQQASQPRLPVEFLASERWRVVEERQSGCMCTPPHVGTQINEYTNIQINKREQTNFFVRILIFFKYG